KSIAGAMGSGDGWFLPVLWWRVWQVKQLRASSGLMAEGNVTFGKELEVDQQMPGVFVCLCVCVCVCECVCVESAKQTGDMSVSVNTLQQRCVCVCVCVCVYVCVCV